MPQTCTRNGSGSSVQSCRQYISSSWLSPYTHLNAFVSLSYLVNASPICGTRFSMSVKSWHCTVLQQCHFVPPYTIHSTSSRWYVHLKQWWVPKPHHHHEHLSVSSCSGVHHIPHLLHLERRLGNPSKRSTHRLMFSLCLMRVHPEASFVVALQHVHACEATV